MKIICTVKKPESSSKNSEIDESYKRKNRFCSLEFFWEILRQCFLSKLARPFIISKGKFPSFCSAKSKKRVIEIKNGDRLPKTSAPKPNKMYITLKKMEKILGEDPSKKKYIENSSMITISSILNSSKPIVRIKNLIKITVILVHIFLFTEIPMELSFGTSILTPSSFPTEMARVSLLLFIFITLITDSFFNCFLNQPAKSSNLKKNLLLEVTTLGPVYAHIIMIVSNSEANFLFQSVSTLRLLFYFRLKNFQRRTQHFNLFNRGHENIWDALLKILLQILILAHLLACIWHWLARFELPSNWVIRGSLENGSVLDRYLASMNFVLSYLTMTNANPANIEPTNSVERIFCLILSPFSTIFLLFNLSRIPLLAQGKKQEIERGFRAISRYLRENKLSSTMESKIMNYLKDYQRIKSLDEDHSYVSRAVESLPFTLKSNIFLKTWYEALRAIPFLSRNFSQTFLNRISHKVIKKTFIPEEVIYKRGKTRENSLYIIIEGQIEVFHQYGSSPDSITLFKKRLKPGDVFGEYCFFTASNRFISVRSIGFTKCLILQREDVLDILEELPEDYEKFSFIKDQLFLDGKYHIVDLKCYMCDSSHHLSEHCIRRTFFLMKKFLLKNHFNKQFSKKNRKKTTKGISALGCKKQIVAAAICMRSLLRGKTQKFSRSQSQGSNPFDANAWEEGEIVHEKMRLINQYDKKNKKQVLLDINTEVSSYIDMSGSAYTEIVLNDVKTRKTSKTNQYTHQYSCGVEKAFSDKIAEPKTKVEHNGPLISEKKNTNSIAENENYTSEKDLEAYDEDDNDYEEELLKSSSPEVTDGYELGDKLSRDTTVILGENISTDDEKNNLLRAKSEYLGNKEVIHQNPSEDYFFIRGFDKKHSFVHYYPHGNFEEFVAAYENVKSLNNPEIE